MANLTSNLTALQLHVAFWDTNGDSIITPHEIYNGFRALGFSILFSLGGLLIPLFFSYPTTLGHSYLPDPLFRIYTSSIHKAKHGSDSGVYTPEGNIRESLFGEMLGMLDSSPEIDIYSQPAALRGEGFVGPRYADEEGEVIAGSKTNETCTKRPQKSLGITDLLNLHARNRVAADPAGWSFAAMEWWTTWLLLQENGRVWEDDLRGVYDGSLFFRIREARMRGGEGGGTLDEEGRLKSQAETEEGLRVGAQVDEKEQGWDKNKGYGWRDWMRGMWRFGNWRVWEVEGLRLDGGRGRDLKEIDLNTGNGNGEL